ncbi:MAG: polyphosphate kinase 1 [Candidatus Competibacterales bacterium]
MDLRDPALYLNRELTWLGFNRRVLFEAEDSRTPLLERVKFLAIVSSNLDEFFMKRIGGLKQQVGAAIRERSVDGRTPQEQISACYQAVRDLEARQRALWLDLLAHLRQKGIDVRAHGELEPDQQRHLKNHYVRNVLPLVTPQAIDPAHPFPIISNQSLNLLVAVSYEGGEETIFNRIKVPVGPGTPRFLTLPPELSRGATCIFVPLEDVMAEHLDLLFPGMVINSCERFRVTRNAVVEQDEEEADDLLQMIESELRERRFAPIVRLEVEAAMNPVHKGMLAAELGLDEAADVFEVAGMMALRDLMALVGLDRPELHDPPHHPKDHPLLGESVNIFHTIREQGAILLQHPYEAFATSVERFVKEASQDPKVRAIKMTLYRTSENTRILEYLEAAAKNAKQVAVVVELKARFDESANIRWANRLNQAGVHVTYGVVGLKTHCKVIFVVRQDYDGLRRYAHIGTGNYHAGTARLYSDLGMLLCDTPLGEEPTGIGSDLTELFNYLTTGCVPHRHYQKLLPAPKVLKPSLLAKIDREIDHQRRGRGGLIQFKMNALEDADLTEALYRASMAGVKVDLIIRDTCRLRPGLANLSETVTVVSIVGRFLEHTRIYYFRNGGDEEYFIGSADGMERNLESRVEVVAPVEPEGLRVHLRQMLDIQLGDQRSAWEMQPDGQYRQRKPPEDDPEAAKGSHEQLIALTEQRHRELKRHAKRRARGLTLGF